MQIHCVIYLNISQSWSYKHSFRHIILKLRSKSYNFLRKFIFDDAWLIDTRARLVNEF